MPKKKKNRVIFEGDPVVSHIPLGSMCINCKKALVKCNHLDFKAFPTKEICKLDGTTFVICLDYLDNKESDV